MAGGTTGATHADALEIIALLEQIGPWVVVCAMSCAILGGLQMWWLTLRGKDSKKVW